MSKIRLNKRVYICGPMTSKPNNNKEQFDEAEKMLIDQGFDPVNPSRVPFGDYDEDKSKIMLVDLGLLSTCNFIYLLPGAYESKGAFAEIAFAQCCGIQELSSIAPGVLSIGPL